jgi:hypothetical protein
VGASTVIDIIGNKFFPGFGDWYLGKTGYKSQQTNEPADPNRPDNLWKPVDRKGGGDRGAHGAFDARAKNKSWQLWADEHRGALALAGAGLLSLVGATLFWRNK